MWTLSGCDLVSGDKVVIPFLVWEVHGGGYLHKGNL